MHFSRQLTGVSGALLPAFAIATLLAAHIPDARADAQEEINKQIAKLTSDAISARLTGVAAAAAPGTPSAAKVNNAWGSYTNLGVEFSAPNTPGGASTTDIALLGYDRDVSKTTTLGVALNTANTRRASGDSWGISPYLAYRFSEHYFAIGRLNYSHGSGSAKFDSYGLGASLNTLQPIGDFLLKGEAGLFFSHSKVRTPAFSSPGVPGIAASTRRDDTLGWNLTGDASYRFGSGWSGFIGLSANGADEAHTASLSGNVGIEKAFGTDGAVMLKYDTRLADDAPSGTDIEVRAVTLALRWRF